MNFLGSIFFFVALLIVTARETQGAVYDVEVKTGDNVYASTDADVRITMIGTLGKSAKIELDTAGKDDFEKGNLDKYRVTTASLLGQLTGVTIEHNNQGSGPGWYCEHITVSDQSDPPQSWFFPCYSWIPPNKGSTVLHKDLTPATAMDYVFEVQTGDRKHASTDARVFVKVTGTAGTTAKIKLNTIHDDFENGNTDKFPIKTINLGDLRQLTIEHDNYDSAPGWYLVQITVYERDNPNHRWQFPCNNWISENTQLSRDLNVKETVYVIEVTTGDVADAGTNADVFITISGTEATLPKSELDNIDYNDFERGKTDKYEITAVHLGELLKLNVQHDNSGAINPNWFLDKIVVYERDNPAKRWNFPCNQWLSIGSQLSRELNAVAGR